MIKYSNAQATPKFEIPGIGIDYGTSNTAAAIYDGSRILLVRLEANSTLMPSAIYFDRDFAVTIGEEAIATYISVNQGRKVELSAEILGEARTGTGQMDADTNLPGTAPTNLIYGRSLQDLGMPGRLFRGIKRLLGNKGNERITIFDRPFRLVAMITPLLLKVQAKIAQTLHDNGFASGIHADHACIGHPVNFEGQEQNHNLLALERLEESYGYAGITQRHLFPEPNAAALSYLFSHPEQTPEVILTVDFGGGTLDFCLLQKQADDYQVLAIHGIGLGGDHIDQCMFREFLFPLLGKGERWRREVDGRIVDTLYPFEAIEELLLNWTVSYMLNQNDYLTPVIDMRRHGAADVAPKFERLYELITQNYSYQVFQRIKECKELLSTQEVVLLDVPEIDVSLEITRADFDRVIAGLLTQFSEAVSATLAKAGLPAEAVSLVLRTGGSCLIPAVTAILDAQFPGRVVEHDPFTSVAAGLAIADYQYQNAGK